MIITKSVKFNNDGSFLFFGSDDLAEAGNNFSVICNGEKYRIESGGEINDTNIKEVASDLSDGTVFGYQGTIYIKKDNRVFKIQKRSGSYTDHYNNLYNLFFGGGDTTSTASANSAGTAAKANPKWTSYQDAADAGYSNIMTRTEWARRKSSTGCNTYQEYLDKMYAKYVG